MICLPLGVFSISWMPALPPLQWLLAALAGCLFVLFYGVRKFSHLIPIAATVLALLIGAVWGTIWGAHQLKARLPAMWEGQLLDVRGTIVSLPSDQWGGYSRLQRFMFEVDGVDCRVDASRCPEDTRKLRLSYYGEEELRPGDRWAFTVKLKRPWGLANPGSFDYQAWLVAGGVHATGYVRRDAAKLLARGGDTSFWARITTIHHRVRAEVRQALQAAELNVSYQVMLGALIIGDRQAMDSEHVALFRKTGTSHLMVISGLHIGLVAAVAYIISRIILTPLLSVVNVLAVRDLALIVSFCVALCYAGLAGFSLSTVRALTMLGCWQTGFLVRRNTSATHSLGAALVLVSLVDPMASHGAGFWLSFGAVVIIFYTLMAQPREIGAADRNGFSFSRPLHSWLRIQLWLWLLLMPLSAFWFGGLSLVSPVANAVAIPLVGNLVVPLGLLGTALLPFSPDWSQALWQIATNLLSYTSQFLQAFENVESVESVEGWSPWLDVSVGAWVAASTSVAVLLLLQ
ncbi:MAG: competence protein ComEC, partial [Halieaceae bacterium]